MIQKKGRKEKRKKERGRGWTNPERRQTLICRQKKIPLTNQDLIFQSWKGWKQDSLLPNLYPRAALNRLPPWWAFPSGTESKKTSIKLDFYAVWYFRLWVRCDCCIYWMPAANQTLCKPQSHSYQIDLIILSLSLFNRLANWNSERLNHFLRP